MKAYFMASSAAGGHWIACSFFKPITAKFSGISYIFVGIYQWSWKYFHKSEVSFSKW